MTTQRTLNRSLIVHNDLALGIGDVAQTRGTMTSIEHKIELPFIFRALDEIRTLDFERYTRVSLHTDGPLIEYYFDAASTASDDGDNVLAPIPPVTAGRWLKVIQIFSYGMIEFNDVSNMINISKAKRAGYMVWDSSSNRPIWAVGPEDVDFWVDANGTTVYTPS